MLRNRIFGVAMAATIAMFFGADRLLAADEPASPPARVRGQGLRQGGSGLALLRLETVAKDLNLTEAQTDSLKKIGDDAHKQMSELRDSLKDTPREERQTKLADAEKEIAKKVAAVLDDKQRARLQEIRLQVRGPAALRETEVADALKLTDEQKKKLNDLAEERRTAIREAIKEAGGDRTASRDKITPIAKDVAAKMQAVLTPEQSEQFEKMKGKKLDLGAAPFGSLGGPGRRASSSSKPESKPESK